jgi:dipeptidyl aminopeptidase/acylaminoacyl peptidase
MTKQALGRSPARSGEWIAYSTVPGDDLWRRWGPDLLGGSAVAVVRPGHEPIVVAGRGDGTTWNVCPRFSPDGSRLAYGTKAAAGMSIGVVRMTRAGTSAGRRARIAVRGGASAPCPRWSADGTRLAYLQGGRVVVRGLDGSVARHRAGDPVREDFLGRHSGSLRSPTGDLVARRAESSCNVVVERPDGTGRRTVPVAPVGSTTCPYAVAAWSPDGRKLLVMFDVSGLSFTMVAVSVDAPFAQVVVVHDVRVNHARSWPGRGDVSWQPVPG